MSAASTGAGAAAADGVVAPAAGEAGSAHRPLLPGLADGPPHPRGAALAVLAGREAPGVAVRPAARGGAVPVLHARVAPTAPSSRSIVVVGLLSGPVAATVGPARRVLRAAGVVAVGASSAGARVLGVAGVVAVRLLAVHAGPRRGLSLVVAPVAAF